METKTPIILLACMSVLSMACDRNTEPDKLQPIEGVTFSIPQFWEKNLDDGGLSLRAPKGVGMYFPVISIVPNESKFTPELVTAAYSVYREDSLSDLSKLEQVRIGNGTGWVYTRHYVDKSARLLPRPKSGDYPLDVEHVEVRYFVVAPRGSFSIRLATPKQLHGSVKPDFEFFLASLKFEPASAK